LTIYYLIKAIDKLKKNNNVQKAFKNIFITIESFLQWMPKQKRARGRPKKNWMEGIRKAMNERNLKEGQWEVRRQWSLRMGQRRKTF